ncbi:MAG: hypothetical protein ABSC95_02705 [Acetobacteraceae bacterium]|jgi:hypothetical protein
MDGLPRVSLTCGISILADNRSDERQYENIDNSCVTHVALPPRHFANNATLARLILIVQQPKREIEMAKSSNEQCRTE